ncbi:MAG TPA: hypothetical protein VKV57_05895 [bacterium]|nr:hypothetical protein [bacterium]
MTDLEQEFCAEQREMEAAECLRSVYEESHRALLHTVQAIEGLVGGLREGRDVAPDVVLSRGLELMKRLRHAGELLHAAVKIADPDSIAPWQVRGRPRG